MRSYAISSPLLLLLVAILMGSAGSVHGQAARESLADKLAAYTFDDSKTLVSLVEDAASLMEQEGTDALREFAVPGSRWLDSEHALFVYAEDGTCLFHPTEPGLVGRNLMALEDINGKHLVREITDVGAKPEPNASGWVFYLWADKTQILPQWKSSYIRKVVAPDRRIYLVGSGLYGMRVEKAFVKARIKDAIRLIQRQGKEAAFAQLRDPASPFVFLDTYIFVLDAEGHALVDPQFPNFEGRDISSFRDAVGFDAVQELLRRLATSNTGWVQYLTERPDSSMPARKLLYARKVTVAGETLIVGRTSIWGRRSG